MSFTIESYRRVRNKDLAPRFYERLLAGSPETRKMFARTDFARQNDLFAHGVLMLLDFAQGKAVARMALQRLGVMHDRAHMDISPMLYENWIESLIQTLSELDDEWSPELERAWRQDLAPGIEFLANAHGLSVMAAASARF